MKRIASIALCLMMVLSLAACGGKSTPSKTSEHEIPIVENNTGNDVEPVIIETPTITETPDNSESIEPSDTSTDTEVVSDEGLTAYEQVALDFINAIKDKDFETVLSLISLDSPEFVTKEDIEKGLYSSTYKNVIGAKGEATVTDSTEDYKSAKVVVEIAKEPFTVNIVEKDDGNFVDIQYSGILVYNFSLETPRNVDMYIEGNSIENYLDSNAENRSTYIIPQIGLLEKSIVGKTEQFGDFESKVIPTTSGYIFNCVLSAEQNESLYKDIKDLLNGILKTYEETNGDAQAFSKYLASWADADIINTISTDLRTGTPTSALSDSSYDKERSFTYVGDWRGEVSPEKPPVRIWDGTHESVIVNISITKTWVNHAGIDMNSTENLSGSLIVAYEDGELKIDSYSGNRLLNIWNSFINDWK